MFQDIEPYEFCNDFSWATPEPTDRVLIYQGDKVLVAKTAEDEPLRFPSYQALLDIGVVGDVQLDEMPAPRKIISSAEASAEYVCTASGYWKELPLRDDGLRTNNLLLFTVGSTAYFRCATNSVALKKLLEGDWEFVSINQLHLRGPKHRAFAGMVGYEYHVWYDTHTFCGRCGALMEHGTIERMLRCPECGCMEFSRLFPAVIVGVVDPETDRVLVSRYANREYKRYALIAGFSEMGETVEQTVHREVMEEVGLKVKNLRYYKSQPWPASSSLLFGFFCELDGSASITLDTHELEHAEWLAREDLPPQEADYSLTRKMMSVLREHREGEHPVTS